MNAGQIITSIKQGQSHELERIHFDTFLHECKLHGLTFRCCVEFEIDKVTLRPIGPNVGRH